MTLDESNDNDEIFDRGGVAFVISRELLEETKSVAVDYVTTPSGEGFTISTGLNSSDGCGSCSTC